MEEEEGGLRLSKRFKDGEVDYNTKAGTAWSHSYLNQKPWHPLSYPNQRRKWIAEQSHAHHQRRAHEVAREYAQEQEIFRQSSLLSQKEKEKVDMMRAVSFMYVRPPGYNAESAKAAEIADMNKKPGESDPNSMPSSSVPQATAPAKEEKKQKSRPKDVFGRTLPTEEEFAVLKDAPRLETGVVGRAKPFAVEVRNVKCVRCGNFGHQSGDRECPLKDAIMPNEENRLKREDPLTAMIAHMDASEPLKWELKQKPGISPPRGGFRPDDPNQQIVAEDIFDEYGGFLSGGGIPELLTNFSSTKYKKKSKSKSKRKKHGSSRHSQDDLNSSSESDDHQRNSKTKLKSRSKHKQRPSSELSSEENDFSKSDKHRKDARRKHRSHKHKRNRKASSRSSTSDDSTSGSDTHERRSRRRERSYKSTKNKDLSHSSSSEESESHKRHGRSRYKLSHHSEHPDSSKYRYCGSSKYTESKGYHEDGSSDGECRSRERNRRRL